MLYLWQYILAGLFITGAFFSFRRAIRKESLRKKMLKVSQPPPPKKLRRIYFIFLGCLLLYAGLKFLFIKQGR